MSVGSANPIGSEGGGHGYGEGFCERVGRVASEILGTVLKVGVKGLAILAATQGGMGAPLDTTQRDIGALVSANVTSNDLRMLPQGSGMCGHRADRFAMRELDEQLGWDLFGIKTFSDELEEIKTLDGRLEAIGARITRFEKALSDEELWEYYLRCPKTRECLTYEQFCTLVKSERAAYVQGLRFLKDWNRGFCDS